MDIKLRKTLICLVLVLISVVSFFVVGDRAGSVSAHTGNIEAIDSKVDTVLKLTATTTVASAGITAIPGDTATPLAEKLADFTEYFLLILCVLYTEKYLLTILGIGAFKILIPLACLLIGISVVTDYPGSKRIGLKVGAFALALYLAIPIGLVVSDKIYRTYEETINTTIQSAETLTQETSELSEATDNDSVFSSILSGLSESVGSLTDKAASLFKRFVETLAVLIVTTCVIPILVVVFMIWITKLLLGKDAVPSMPKFDWRRGRKNGPKEEPGSL